MRFGTIKGATGTPTSGYVPIASSTAGAWNWNPQGITPRIQSVVSAATVTPNWDTDDEVVITAQAVGLTLANPTGTTPAQGRKLIIRIKDNGISQFISFGTNYRVIGTSLPTSTVASKNLYIGIIYNVTDSKLDIVSIAQET
jgi:hypothetical protein